LHLKGSVNSDEATQAYSYALSFCVNLSLYVYCFYILTGPVSTLELYSGVQ